MLRVCRQGCADQAGNPLLRSFPGSIPWVLQAQEAARGICHVARIPWAVCHRADSHQACYLQITVKPVSVPLELCRDRVGILRGISSPEVRVDRRGGLRNFNREEGKVRVKGRRRVSRSRGRQHRSSSKGRKLKDSSIRSLYLGTPLHSLGR